MVHKRNARLAERRSLLEGIIRRLLMRLLRGDLQPQEGLRQVRNIYSDEIALMRELKAMAEMDDPSDEEIKAEAENWMRQHPLVN